MSTASVQADPIATARTKSDELKSMFIARGLWNRVDFDSLQTHLEEGDDERCVLCGVMVPIGPCFLVYNPTTKDPAGYADYACHDLALYSGVTRWEAANFRPGTVLVPAGAARELVERENAAIARRRAL